jgi:hypothetical protein
MRYIRRDKHRMENVPRTKWGFQNPASSWDSFKYLNALRHFHRQSWIWLALPAWVLIVAWIIVALYIMSTSKNLVCMLPKGIEGAFPGNDSMEPPGVVRYGVCIAITILSRCASSFCIIFLDAWTIYCSEFSVLYSLDLLIPLFSEVYWPDNYSGWSDAEDFEFALMHKAVLLTISSVDAL